MWEGVRIFVGGHAHSIQGRLVRLGGDRCFSPVHAPPKYIDTDGLRILLDSGAYSEPLEKQPSFEGALERQLTWEHRASEAWGTRIMAEALVSRDCLIDEKWTGQSRKKQRWSVAEADHAVRVTVDAAGYLASRRRELAPRQLVLACQGVDASQQKECAAGVLEHAKPDDVFGLGGWCILGRQTRWMPTFWESMRRVLPRVASCGLTHVHIFGVLYQPALGGLLWLADQLGLAVSTDSSSPLLRGRYTTPVARKKAGALAETWEENVALFKGRTASLRQSVYYREPPDPAVMRQTCFT